MKGWEWHTVVQIFKFYQMINHIPRILLQRSIRRLMSEWFIWYAACFKILKELCSTVWWAEKNILFNVQICQSLLLIHLDKQLHLILIFDVIKLLLLLIRWAMKLWPNEINIHTQLKMTSNLHRTPAHSSPLVNAANNPISLRPGTQYYLINLPLSRWLKCFSYIPSIH